jgi:methionyl-tRNA synthetase
VLRERGAEAFDALALHDALGAIGVFVREANTHLEVNGPWRLINAGEVERARAVLAHAVEAARVAAWQYAPFIPRTATEAHQRLAGTPLLPDGGIFAPRAACVRTGAPLFPRQ